jgi:ribosome-associated protein YbcJ (S4-like RNA binding protein)
MDALLNDETLVNGDIVSTRKGLKVFHGQSNVPHSLADFE